MLYLEQQDKVKAKKYLEKYIKNGSGEYLLNAYNSLATLAIEQEDYSQADEYLSKARRAAKGAAAKQLWKSKPGMDLRITKARKPEWLAQNLDNPFRGWDGAEHIPAAAAKKAANQYRKTRSQLMKLAAEPGEDAQAQALEAVAAYTQTFNKMGFIETEERDEIYMALRGILDALPGDALQKDALLEQFEQLRDF